MEFTYEIDKQKAMKVSKENVVYSYGFRRKFATWFFSLISILLLVSIIAQLFSEISIVNLAFFLFLLLISLALVFKGEELQIKALQNQTVKFYKKKSKLQRKVIIDKNQITITYEGKKSKSFSLDSIKHIAYRSDLGGIFFSKSKLARFVFFIDLSNLEEESKEEVFKILLDNLTDKDAQQELKNSLPKNY
ncbi:MAG: hypothetical protein ACOCV1_04580 [Bacillota bacterium]